MASATIQVLSHWPLKNNDSSQEVNGDLQKGTAIASLGCAPNSLYIENMVLSIDLEFSSPLSLWFVALATEMPLDKGGSTNSRGPRAPWLPALAASDTFQHLALAAYHGRLDPESGTFWWAQWLRSYNQNLKKCGFISGL